MNNPEFAAEYRQARAEQADWRSANGGHDNEMHGQFVTIDTLCGAAVNSELCGHAWDHHREHGVELLECMACDDWHVFKPLRLSGS